MKHYIFILLFILFFFFVLPSVIHAWTGTTESVVDGDTLVARNTGQDSNIKIRLYGIDTPESNQDFGSKAKDFVANELKDNQEIEVIPIDKDKYGRVVALVLYGEKDKCLNEELITNGYAWVYDYFCKEQFCESWKATESKAQENEIGLWSQEDPVPPWKWRER